MNAISALRDADTCWLLALGKIISEQGLPATEPFSYTYYVMSQLGTANAFVMHQWLAELLIFLSYKAFGLMGLGLLVTALTSITMAALPAFCQKESKVDIAFVMIVGSLAQLSCCFRSFARPEIFTYLFFILALQLISRLLDREKTSSHKLCLILYASITTLWCNTHTSFVLMVGLAFIPLTVWLIQSISDRTSSTQTNGNEKEIRKFPAISFLLLPILAFFASLLNPAGIKLWAYLPNLFFTKVPIEEFRSISLADLHTVGIYPSLAMLIFYFVCLVKYCSKEKDSHRPFHMVLGLLTLALAAVKIRFVIYALIVVAFELPLFLTKLTNIKIENISPKTRLLSLLAPLTCICGSIFVATRVSPPQLPQPMPNFQPPFSAIAYLKEKPPAGPVLNEPRFGDMMIWYLQPPIPVFIDTRLDMYGDAFCYQYLKIVLCQEGWQKALDDFGIQWVFLPPDQPLVKALSQNQSWRIVFKDKTAVILVKH